MKNSQEIIDRIQQHSGISLVAASESYGMLQVEIAPSSIIPFLTWLRNDEMRFDFLTDLCGVHYPEQEGREIGVVYHVQSMIHNLRLRIKCFIPVSNPEIDSATVLYEAANWMERETYDFFGVIFKGHPNLRRVLNVDEMDYFPLRKEYPLEDGTRTDKEDKYFGR